MKNSPIVAGDMSAPVIGVLSLQGCVEPHRPHIEAAGGVFRPVKTAAQFDEVEALVLPGGESTTMLKLIDNFSLWDSLAATLKEKPVWGICAGAILLARTVRDPQQKSFGVIDMAVRRNGYGRQLDSITMEIDGYTVSFIRAPVIEAVNDTGAAILAERDGHPVWLQSGQTMVTTFHPELTLSYPSPMHRAFIDLVREAARYDRYRA